MIVDFIQIKETLDKAARNFLRTAIRERTPFVSQIGIVRQHEGSDASYETVDNEVNEIDYVPISSEPIQLSKEDMAKLSLREVEQLLLKMAEDFAHKSERFALQRASEIIEQAGNAITENKPIDDESFLKVLEQIQVDFDDSRDRPDMPSIVLHPDTFQRLKEQRAAMSEEEIKAIEFRKDQILDKKFEEYVSRENNRKLVD